MKAYARTIESGFKPEWRRIVGWVDRLVFQDVDINDTESFETGKQRAEQVLRFLRTWYDKIMLPEHVYAYAHIALEKEIGRHVVTDVIPVIKLGEKPTILSVSDVVQADWQLYNDIVVRGQALLVASELECESVAYQRLTMGSRGGFTEQTIHIDSKGHERTRQMLTQLATVIDAGADWPSYSDHCNSCPFKRRCMI